MSKHMKYMELCERIAIGNSPVASARIASVLVIRNDIISIGCNEMKTHPFQKKYSKNPDAIFLHSEINAIKNALKVVAVEELRKATLYICRVKRFQPFSSFVWGNSCPCSGCTAAIVAFDIKKIVHSTDMNGKVFNILER